MTLEMKYRDYLEQGLEKGMERGLKKGYAKGVHKANLKTANNLKKMGLSYAQISQATGLSVEEIQRI